MGTSLLYFATAILLDPPSAWVFVAQAVIGGAAGAIVLAGLWTPVVASVAALDQIWTASSLPASPGGAWIHVLLAALCSSVAMLGPGAWSIDAHLFGRRRFPLHQRKARNHPPKG